MLTLLKLANNSMHRKNTIFRYIEMHTAKKRSISLHENPYDDIMETFVKEIRLMHELKGNTNIVSYEDHKVLKRKNEIGYDIFIRMEKLENVTSVISRRELTQSDVVKLGIDICKALEMLAAKNIIHRDIKLGNLFVNENGDYKLGDFGIARQIDTNMSMRSGTLNFMSPEVFKGQSYDATADIYSLGLVLYRLLNANRNPFLPLTVDLVRLTDNEKAISRRMNGEDIPCPAYADEVLSRIVLKACAYDPRLRFLAASEFRAVLQQYAEGNAARVLPVISSEESARRGNGIDSSKTGEATAGVFGVGSMGSHFLPDESRTEGAFTGNAHIAQPPSFSKTYDETEGVYSSRDDRPRAFHTDRTNDRTGDVTEGVFNQTDQYNVFHTEQTGDATEGAYDQYVFRPEQANYSEPESSYTKQPYTEPESSFMQPPSSSQRITLTEYEPMEYGGYRFICDNESNNCLYRINLRTLDREMISDGACNGFLIDNGHVYYATDSGLNSVFYNKNDS